MIRWLSAAAIVLVGPGCSDALGGGDAGSGAGGGTSARDLGNPCVQSTDCSSNVCIPTGATTENVSGLCSSPCGSSADCGSQGVCLANGTETDCFRRCTSAADCAGIPCVWSPPAGSGICLPIPSNICGSGTTQCIACASLQCCEEYPSCIADLACGHDVAGCTTGACLTKLVSSSDATEAALGVCMATHCASVCP